MIHYFSPSLNNTKATISAHLMDIFATSESTEKNTVINEGYHHGEPISQSLLSSPLPSELPEPEVADAMIAKEMSSTPAQDLERAYFDVHGIVSNTTVQETPELVNQSLQLLHHQVQTLPDNSAYLRAKHQNEHYVSNRGFLLLFLRAEQFDIQAAALRLARHFQVKQELFGVDKLASDITQDDLDQETMDSLYSGYTQHLPQTDRSGRTVVVFRAGLQTRVSIISKLKRMFYTAMAVFPNNEQTQKLGVVSVIYMHRSKGDTKESTNDDRPDREVPWKICQLIRGMPFRPSAIHICYDSVLWSPIIATIKMALTAFTRIRIKTHFGSPADCLSALQGYGIQPCFFPITEQGEMKTKDYKAWLEGQRRKERRTMPRRTKIYVPGSFDVLFGKGSPLQNHTGNVKLRGLIADCKATYEKTEKGRKNEVTRAVIDIVKESSGLFLKQDGNDGWVLVDDVAAQLKVSTLFRSLRGGKKAKKAPMSARAIAASSKQSKSLQRMGGIKSTSYPPTGPSGQKSAGGNDDNVVVDNDAIQEVVGL